MNRLVLGVAYGLCATLLPQCEKQSRRIETARFGEACDAAYENALDAAGLSLTLASSQDRGRFEIPAAVGRPLLVVAVRPESPAASAGLEVGDVVLLVDSRGVGAVQDINDLYVLGRQTPVLYQRRGNTHYGELPSFDCVPGTGAVVVEHGSERLAEGW